MFWKKHQKNIIIFGTLVFLLLVGLICSSFYNDDINPFPVFATGKLSSATIEMWNHTGYKNKKILNEEEKEQFIQAYRDSMPCLFRRPIHVPTKAEQEESLKVPMGAPDRDRTDYWMYSIIFPSGKVYSFTVYTKYSKDGLPMQYHACIPEKKRVGMGYYSSPFFRLRNPDALKNMPGVGECFR